MHFWTLLALLCYLPQTVLAEEKKAPSVTKADNKGTPTAPPLPSLNNKGKKVNPKAKRKPANDQETSGAGKQSFLKDLSVEVQIEGGYHLINAAEKSVTATAYLVSELSPRLSLGLEKDFKLLTVGLEGGIDQRTYSAIPGITTSGLSHSLITLGLKVGRNWTPDFSTDLMPFFGGQTVFYRVNARTMKAVPLNAIGGLLNIHYRYALPFNLAADVKLQGILRAPATQKPLTTTLGYGGSGYLGLVLKIKRLQAGLGLMGAYEQRPATLLSFDTISLGARVTASYTF